MSMRSNSMIGLLLGHGDVSLRTLDLPPEIIGRRRVGRSVSDAGRADFNESRVSRKEEYSGQRILTSARKKPYSSGGKRFFGPTRLGHSAVFDATSLSPPNPTRCRHGVA